MRRDERRETRVGEPSDDRPCETAAERNRSAEQQLALEDEQSADVRERQAGEPPILGTRVDGRSRREDSGFHGSRGKLGQSDLSRCPRRGDDELDCRIDRLAVDTMRTILVEDQRGLRRGQEPGTLGTREADVDGKHCGSHGLGMPEDREPSRSRLERDSDEIPDAHDAAWIGGGHQPSVPRAPARTPSVYHRPRSIRDQREVHRIVEWVASGEWEDIRYETAGGIAKLTINRPEVRNAFRPATLFELSRAFERARDDPEIGAIVLTGEGPDAFCSGGDQRVRGDDGYRDAAGIGRLNVLDLQVQIRRLPKPVVAMVAGYAIGGGHVLHLVCDLTIAADNARFGQTGPRVGSFDAGYGSGLLARTIGLKRAKEIWFLCEQYDAATAERWGLVNRVVPLDRLEEETVAVCNRMLEMSPLALRLLKAGFNADTDGLAGVQQLAGDATLLFYMSEEAQEGRDAYVEKRKPDFAKFPHRP